MALSIILLIIAFIAFNVLLLAKRKSIVFKLGFFAISFATLFMGILNFLLIFDLNI